MSKNTNELKTHAPGRSGMILPGVRTAGRHAGARSPYSCIERHGRREWYKLSGCTERSMVENAVYRYKAIIGSEMRARTLARQRVEHRIGCEILNKMTALGMPDTYCTG